MTAGCDSEAAAADRRSSPPAECRGQNPKSGAAFLRFVLASVELQDVYREEGGQQVFVPGSEMTTTKNNWSKFDKVHASMMCAAEVPLAGI